MDNTSWLWLPFKLDEAIRGTPSVIVSQASHRESRLPLAVFHTPLDAKERIIGRKECHTRHPYSTRRTPLDTSSRKFQSHKKSYLSFAVRCWPHRRCRVTWFMRRSTLLSSRSFCNALVHSFVFHSPLGGLWRRVNHWNPIATLIKQQKQVVTMAAEEVLQHYRLSVVGPSGRNMRCDNRE